MTMRFRLRTLMIVTMFGPPVLAFALLWPGVVIGLLAMSPLAMLPVLIYRTVEYLLAAGRRGQEPQD